MEKLDLKKARKALFSAPRNRFVPLDVPSVSYLMADGHGDPNTIPEYRLAVESLYAVAYTTKFALKAKERDFVVMPLEGLWSASDPDSFIARRKHEWDWTMMIMVADYVDEDAFLTAQLRARDKLGTFTAGLRLQCLEEGFAFRHCTSAATTTKDLCSLCCMNRSCRQAGTASPAGIMRSTLATLAERPPKSSRP